MKQKDIAQNYFLTCKTNLKTKLFGVQFWFSLKTNTNRIGKNDLKC